MILALALLLLAVQAPAAADPAAGERVRLTVAANCGIDAGRLAVERLAGGTGTSALVLKGVGPLSDTQLRCYGDALTDSDLYPAIEDEALSRRYSRLVADDLLEHARLFLRDMGRLDDLPGRRRDEPLDFYARRLEAFCGAPVGNVLRVENGHLTLAHPDAEPRPSEDPRAWLCAFNAAVVAGYNPLLPPPTPVPSE